MIESVKPAARRAKGTGHSTLLHPSRAAFPLSARQRSALARLLQAQHDAFAEAESGLQRPLDREPFTLAELDLLAPLMGWLREEAASASAVLLKGSLSPEGSAGKIP